MPEETVTEFRQETKQDSPKYLAPVAIGLGILLIVGGIAFGITKKDNDLAELPEYSPFFVSPKAQPTASPLVTLTTTPSPVIVEINPQEASRLLGEAPANQSVALQAAKPKVAGVSTAKPDGGKRSELPLYTPTSVLPAYSPPVVSLPDYQPQYVSPSPTATPSPVSQTINVTFTVAGQLYTVSVAKGSTVLEAMRAAQNQGLNYVTQEFSGLGAKVTSLNGVSEGGGRYWLYTINGNFANKGISSQTLDVNSVITWTLS